MRGSSLRAARLGFRVGLLWDAAKCLSGRGGGSSYGRAGNGAASNLDDVSVRGVEIGLGHADLIVGQVVDHIR